jgi:hypothetical protein
MTPYNVISDFPKDNLFRDLPFAALRLTKTIRNRNYLKDIWWKIRIWQNNVPVQKV